MKNMKINRKQGFRFLRIVMVMLLIISLCCGTLNGCADDIVENDGNTDSGDDIMENVSYIAYEDVFEEFVDLNRIGDGLNTTIYGINISAVYDKTIHYLIGDTTEIQYSINYLEKDGVRYSVLSKDYYICLDTNGNVVHLSLDNIMNTDLKCWYDQNDENVIRYGYTFGKSEDEIRLAMEEKLGDIVDWSKYGYFQIKFNNWLDEYSIRNYRIDDGYTAVVFIWTQTIRDDNVKGSYRDTTNEFRCMVEFASDKTTEETDEAQSNYGNVYIRGFTFNNAFGDRTDFSECCERLSGITGIKQAINERFSDKGFTARIEDDAITVYNGKISLVTTSSISKSEPSNYRTVYMIIPLE